VISLEVSGSVTFFFSNSLFQAIEASKFHAVCFFFNPMAEAIMMRMNIAVVLCGANRKRYHNTTSHFLFCQ
jgi:hypothetical protein